MSIGFEKEKGNKCHWGEVGGQRISQNGVRAGSKIFPVDFKFAIPEAKASIFKV